MKLAEMLLDKYKIVLAGLNKKLPDNILGLPRTESAKQLAEIYTAADVFVNLSYEENYPTVNLEAQACGTPVIAYDVGGTKETFGLTVIETQACGTPVIVYKGTACEEIADSRNSVCVDMDIEDVIGAVLKCFK